MRDLRPLLAPASIAIVGASSRLESVAGRPLTNLLRMGYKGALYPINPRSTEIAGVRCYSTLAELPEAPELALLVLPTEAVLPVLEECAGKKVLAAIVISAGFAETGAEGARAQETMRALARESGMVICGPNSLGVLNFVDRIPLTFGSAVDMETSPPGRVALVSQSGGIMVGLANQAFDAKVGVSYAVATGNEADLELTEVLEYLAEDSSTGVVVAIIETIRDGARFLAVCDRLLQLRKPLVAYKIGRSERGSSVARSHTGALAGSYAALQAVFRQRGVVEARDIDDLFPLAGALSAGRFPSSDGIAVITESGGSAAIVADRADELGLAVPAIGPQTAERLRQFLPKFAAAEVQNPFDVTAAISENPQSVGPMAEALLDDPAIGSLMVIFAGSGEAGKKRAEALLDHVQTSAKPVLGVTLAGSSASPLYDLMMSRNVPAFHSASRAVEAIAALRHFAGACQRRCVPSSPRLVNEDFQALARQELAKLGQESTEHEAKRFLAQFGVQVVEERLAGTPSEAVAHAEALGYPVALKVQSPQIVHKTEAGGVRLNLTKEEAVRAAYAEIVAKARGAVPKATITGILVSRMMPAPLEMIAGVHDDPTFGPLVLFGLGGIWVEVFNEVAMRPAPLSPEDAAEMVDQLRGAPLLRGARNLPPVRPEAIESLLLALSNLAVATRGLLSGLDINPLVPSADGGLVALDASLYLLRTRSGSG
ncbi:MAG: acetate--CoA ligase family protein [Acidobacteria bacterium]|nr:acetate--CoA ligase family protein [Acidobacteriota bacterium]